MKPFARTEFLKKFHLHSSNINWEEFHQKYIPKSHLPSDYGGDLRSIKEMHEESPEILQRFKTYFAVDARGMRGELDYLAEEAKTADW